METLKSILLGLALLGIVSVVWAVVSAIVFYLTGEKEWAALTPLFIATTSFIAFIIGDAVRGG